MPNIKSAIKRVKVIEKKTAENKSVKTAIKSQEKKFRTALSNGDKENAKVMYNELVSLLDSAATKNVIHKNAANRTKARLAILLTK